MRNPNGFIRPGYDPLQVADAPTAVTPTAGSEAASVDFTSPSNVGGAAVSEYYAVVQPGNITATSVTPPVAVSGLTNGTEYTTKVWANNSYGPSPYSAESSGFTPAPPNVEDVFSTYLYTGTGSTQTITNGIDLAGEGGLVWNKGRSVASNHDLIDTVRGVDQALFSNTTGATNTAPAGTGITSFNSNGFTFGTTNYTGMNQSGETSVTWSFRKSPKFFDIVTYTGNGVAGRTVAHNLESEPGMVIVKCTSAVSSWQVFHTGAPTGSLVLNSTAALDTVSAQYYFGNNTNIVAPTASNFTVGGTYAGTQVNQSGATYVAYLFAHDAGGFGDDGEQNVISCGSFNTDGSAYANVNLGYEPQMVMVKRTDGVGNWRIQDNMRGMATYGGQIANLYPNLADAEGSGTGGSHPTATGFESTGLGVSQTYIYIAIRRPMKTPESGTEVFNALTRTGTDATAQVTGVGFAPDLVNVLKRQGGTRLFSDRLRGRAVSLLSTSTNAETTSVNAGNDIVSYNMDGITLGPNWNIDVNSSAEPYVNYFLKRAPGFFDEVCYTGNGGNMTISHNLGVVPTLMIVKGRNATAGGQWKVYDVFDGNDNYMALNTTAATASGYGAYWNTTTPTSTVFYVGSNNTTNTGTYVAYLFATLAGVSKVGSYTGTGTTLQIDCGFSAGARFILIKRTDSTGDWYVWDSVRGIAAGNDPYLLLNSTAAEVTSTDYIDPLSSGFTVTSNASSTVNVSTGTYIFLAIA